MMEKIDTVDESESGFREYGHLKQFDIDKRREVAVLITGAGSYIGRSFVSYCEKYYRNIRIDTIDMMDDGWRNASFKVAEGKPYDAVFHVAGIAHADIGRVSAEEKRKYYAVNTELAVETARKAKESGVEQFILMSSMIVYGNEERIDEHTVPHPINFYGDSKWRADKDIRKLADKNFHVAVLRSPMIYGKGAKGNFQVLAKIARCTPIFPDYKNKRSMLYIENLCEFVAQLSLSGEGGIYFPQDAEYISTSEMVKIIGEAAHSPVRCVPIPATVITLAMRLPGRIGALAGKAFRDRYYEQALSKYEGISYQAEGLKEAIWQTESEGLRPRIEEIRESADVTAPFFSIITVCHNSENVIERTIISVLGQTYDRIEYIIVDGASADRTVTIAEGYRERFKERGYVYQIISEPDQGIYDAMNKGIGLADGVLIGFINAGDWYERNAVDVVAREYRKVQFDYFYADIKLIRADGSVLVKRSGMGRIATSRRWNHPSSFAAKELYEELGRFKCEGIHDDFEFYLRVRKAGKRIRVVSKVLANFVTGGASNEKSAILCRQRIRERYRGYLENGYSPLYFFECVGVEAAKYILC